MRMFTPPWAAMVATSAPRLATGIDMSVTLVCSRSLDPPQRTMSWPLLNEEWSARYIPIWVSRLGVPSADSPVAECVSAPLKA